MTLEKVNGKPFTHSHNRVTSYPALKWFQISINNNVLVTNKLLQQMRIKNDGLCTSCQSSNETIIHLFWQCQMTQNFIKSVVAWLSTYDIDCHISEKIFHTWMAGRTEFFESSKLDNTVCKILYLFNKM